VKINDFLNLKTGDCLDIVDDKTNIGHLWSFVTFPVSPNTIALKNLIVLSRYFSNCHSVDNPDSFLLANIRSELGYFKEGETV